MNYSRRYYEMIFIFCPKRFISIYKNNNINGTIISSPLWKLLTNSIF